MPRLRLNDVSSFSSNLATLSASGATISWTSAPPIPTIAAPVYMSLILEPGTLNEEIVWLTSYTFGATSGIVTRNAEATAGGVNSAPAHTSVLWAHGPTVADFGSTAWFNVQKYGAVGNGSIDDTSAINAAISALNAAGSGVLYFPSTPQYYLCSSALTALTAPFQVLGDVRGNDNRSAVYGSKVVQTSTTANLFTVNSLVGLFRDISLINRALTNPTAGAGIEVTNGTTYAQQIDYERVTVSGFYICVDVQVGSLWNMHSCFIEGPVLYGLRVQNTVNADAGDWSVSDSWFYSSLRSSTAAIYIASSGGGKINNVKINVGATYYSTYGIQLAASSTSSDLQISNTSIENVASHGITLSQSGTETWRNITITGVQVTPGTSAGCGVYLNGGSGNYIGYVAVTGCVFSAGVSATVPAISATNITDICITGCVSDNTFTALYSLSGCTLVTPTAISGVTVSGTPSSGQVLTATGSSTADWQTPSGGGGGGGGSQIIAMTTYAPDTNFLAANVTSMTAIDTANLRLAIPSGFAGGDIIVTLTCLCSLNTTGNTAFWGLMKGATVLAVAWLTSSTEYEARTIRIPLTGLAAGAQNLDWAYMLSGPTSQLLMYASPLTSGSNHWGLAVMTAELAP